MYASLAICITGEFRAHDLTFANHEWAIPLYAHADKFVVYGQDWELPYVQHLRPVYAIKSDYKRPVTNFPRSLLKMRRAFHAAKLLLQWQDWLTCWRSVLAYEARMLETHDVYMRLRPDLVFVKTMFAVPLVPKTLFVPDHDGFDGVNDRYAYGDREAMRVYFTLFENRTQAADSVYKAYNEGLGRGPMGAPETILKHHLLAGGVRIRRSSGIRICRVKHVGRDLHLREIEYHTAVACRVPYVNEVSGQRKLFSAPPIASRSLG